MMPLTTGSCLSQSDLQQKQDHLGVFGIVLVPEVVHRFAGAGERQRGNQPQLKNLLVEKNTPAADVSSRSLQNRSGLNS